MRTPYQHAPYITVSNILAHAQHIKKDPHSKKKIIIPRKLHAATHRESLHSQIVRQKANFDRSFLDFWTYRLSPCLSDSPRGDFADPTPRVGSAAELLNKTVSSLLALWAQSLIFKLLVAGFLFLKLRVANPVKAAPCMHLAHVRACDVLRRSAATTISYHWPLVCYIFVLLCT